MEGPVIDESALSTKELLGLHQAEERLKRDCIDRLKRVPSLRICLLERVCVFLYTVLVMQHLPQWIRLSTSLSLCKSVC